MSVIAPRQTEVARRWLVRRFNPDMLIVGKRLAMIQSLAREWPWLVGSLGVAIVLASAAITLGGAHPYGAGRAVLPSAILIYAYAISVRWTLWVVRTANRSH